MAVSFDMRLPFPRRTHAHSLLCGGYSAADVVDVIDEVNLSQKHPPATVTIQANLIKNDLGWHAFLQASFEVLPLVCDDT